MQPLIRVVNALIVVISSGILGLLIKSKGNCENSSHDKNSEASSDTVQGMLLPLEMNFVQLFLSVG